MQIGGSGVDLFGLYALAIIFNQIGLLWACGVAMRFRSVQAGPLMQTPVFMALFLAPVYVPLELLRGWIHAVARLNPLTFILEAGRGFIEGEPTQVATGVRPRCSRSSSSSPSGRGPGSGPPSTPASSRQRVPLKVSQPARLAALVAAREPLLTLGRRSVRPRLRVHLPLRLLLDPVVADGGRGVEAVVHVLLREVDDVAGRDRVARPHTGVAVRLQLGAHRAPVAPCDCCPRRSPSRSCA